MNAQLIKRRQFLQGWCGRLHTVFRIQTGRSCRGLGPVSMESLGTIGSLREPDENGVMLPPGFKSRIVARSGERPVASSDYVWHDAPDGGAVFATGDGGWIYVSNASELAGNRGGVGALRFNRSGRPADAYPVLQGTSINCAGGKTPWQTWLSCQEFEGGRVYECDLFLASGRPR